MIVNPILRKEVLSGLRTKKAVAMQGMFLLVVAAIFWLLWPESGLQDLNGQQAREILRVLAIGQMVMVALFAPAFTAAALTSEREHHTLESVFATSMKPWEIALGKMAGSLTFLLLIVLSGIPALAMLFLLGGVSGSEILAVVALLLLTAIYLGMIGLLISSIMHRSIRAIIVTYAVLGVLCFLVAVPAWPVGAHLLHKGGPTVQIILHSLASFSPIQAMFSLISPDGPYTTGARNMPEFWVMFIPQSLLVIVFTTIWTLYKLHRPIAPPRPREKLKVVERGQFNARSVMFIIDPRKRKRSISFWQNPVLIKEFRTRPMLQAHWLLRAIGFCLIASVLLMFLVVFGIGALAQEGQADTVGMAMTAVGAMMVALILLIGPAMTSSSICSDLETGVWDLMRTTPIPSWRVVSGKFQSAIIPLLLLAISMIPALLVLLYFNPNIALNLLRILEVTGVTILFIATAGTFFSGLFKRTATATAWTYALVVCMTLLSLMALIGKELFSDRLLRYVYMLNPVAVAMDAAGYEPMQRYGLVSSHLKLMLVLTAVMFLVSVARVVQLRHPD
ncbi:MAG: ABC transporter permease [Phycisphaerae bacterium]